MFIVPGVKPACFNHLPDMSAYFDVAHNNKSCAFVGVEFNSNGKTAHLHIEFIEFNHHILNTIKEIAWPRVVEFCIENGCTTLVVSKETKSDQELKKFKRFINYFDFKEPRQICLAVQRV